MFLLFIFFMMRSTSFSLSLFSYLPGLLYLLFLLLLSLIWNVPFYHLIEFIIVEFVSFSI